MKKKEKIMIALSIVMFAAAIAIFLFYHPKPRVSPEEVEIIEFNEVESLNLVGPGDEIVDIEEDIRMLDEQLESTSKELFDGLDAELQQL